MAEYKLTQSGGVLRTADGVFVPDSAGNRDWQAYQAWLGGGGVPDAADKTALQDAKDRATERVHRKADVGYRAARDLQPDWEYFDGLVREIMMLNFGLPKVNSNFPLMAALLDGTNTSITAVATNVVAPMVVAYNTAIEAVRATKETEIAQVAAAASAAEANLIGLQPAPQ
ncbi:MAG: hypothetical protein R3F33_11045 [Planctomycetota bacterium]